MGGGSGNFAQAITNSVAIANPFKDLNSLANTALQISTLGIAGVDSSGKIAAGQIGGAIAHGATEVIGEVTGRNAARESTYQNNVALDNAVDANKTNLKNQAKQKQNSDIAASSTAAALRATASASNRNSLGGIGISNNSSGQFLGI